MSVKISYSNKKFTNSLSNIVFFTNEKFNIKDFRKNLSGSEFFFISDLLKTSDFKKNILIFELSSKKKVILVSIKNDLKSSDIESLGAEFYGRINFGKKTEYFLNSDSINNKHKNFISYFLHGLKLKSYEFKKYKTKKETRLIILNILGSKE